MRKLKSLRETLMISVVIKFDVIFERFRSSSYRTIEKTLLPPCLFEKIIAKSIEMKWSIYFVSDMLAFRDILNWKNIDTKSNQVNNHAFSSLNKVKHYPLTSLAIYVNAITEESLGHLCCMGSTIECLDLRYRCRTTRKILHAPFPRLKKLHLTHNFGEEKMDEPINLDLSRFSSTLEELSLHMERLDESSIKSIADLKRLKVLSIKHARSICESPLFPESLESMIELRTLDLQGSISEQVQHKLLAVIKKLPNLENFDMSHNSEIGEDWIMECVRSRRWNKFGMYRCRDVTNTLTPYCEFKPWVHQIFAMYDETLVSTLEHYIQEIDADSVIVERIVENIHFIPDDLTPRIENALLNAFKRRFHVTSTRQIVKYLETRRCTRDFVMKLLNILCTRNDSDSRRPLGRLCRGLKGKRLVQVIKSEVVARAMLDTVRNNLNKDLSLELLWTLYTIFIEDASSRTLLKFNPKIIEKAIYNQLTENDIEVYMKELLLKLNKIEA